MVKTSFQQISETYAKNFGPLIQIKELPTTKFYVTHGWMVKCHHRVKSLLNLHKEMFKIWQPKKRNILLKNKSMRLKEKDLIEVLKEIIIQTILQAKKWKTSSKLMETTITCYLILNQIRSKLRLYRFYKDKILKLLQMRKNTKLCLNKKTSQLMKKMLNTVRKFKFKLKLQNWMSQHVLLNSTSFQEIKFSSWQTWKKRKKRHSRSLLFEIRVIL